jgi:DNA helicase-2/ATP-dependent DNA helicase PcrA
MAEHQQTWLDVLNYQQINAVTLDDSLLLFVAGAGTGKTLTLAAKVAHLISKRVPSERILLLTFTRRAAEEMLNKAARAIFQCAAATRVWGGTFHSIANRLLRMYGQLAGLSPGLYHRPSLVAGERVRCLS